MRWCITVPDFSRKQKFEWWWTGRKESKRRIRATERTLVNSFLLLSRSKPTRQGPLKNSSASSLNFNLTARIDDCAFIFLSSRGTLQLAGDQLGPPRRSNQKYLNSENDGLAIDISMLQMLHYCFTSQHCTNILINRWFQTVYKIIINSRCSTSGYI